VAEGKPHEPLLFELKSNVTLRPARNRRVKNQVFDLQRLSFEGANAVLGGVSRHEEAKLSAVHCDHGCNFHCRVVTQSTIRDLGRRSCVLDCIIDASCQSRSSGVEQERTKEDNACGGSTRERRRSASVHVFGCRSGSAGINQRSPNRTSQPEAATCALLRGFHWVCPRPTLSGPLDPPRGRQRRLGTENPLRPTLRWGRPISWARAKVSVP
jgi:hypothetical protein